MGECVAALILLVLINGFSEVTLQTEEEENGLFFYGAEGERQWPGLCNSGIEQSPINIMTKQVQKMKASKKNSLIFRNYNEETEAEIENNGHTVQITPLNSSMFIEGGVLRSQYRLLQIHFHWESEHTINSNRFPLEAHFVHMKNSLSSIEEAKAAKDGVAVLAVLYNYDAEDNEDIGNVTSAARDVNTIFATTTNYSVNPSYLLPETSSYFTYNGSLTTPECLEIVTWIIFDDIVPISRRQWNEFKQSETMHGTDSSNFRQTKPLGTRRVMLMQHHATKRLSSSEGFKRKSYLLLILVSVFTSILSSNL